MSWHMDGHLLAQDPHKMYGLRGGGGLELDAPVTGLGVLTTTPTKIPGTAYSGEIAVDPIGMEQDLTNGRLRLLDDGLWYFTANFTGVIIPVTANASNRVNLVIYNETDGMMGEQPSFFVVPRYGDAIDINVGSLFRVTESLVNKWFSLYIWVEYATPAIDVTDLLSLELSVFRTG